MKLSCFAMNFPPQTKTYTSYHITLLEHIFKRRNYYLTPYYRPTKVRPLTSQSTVRWNIAKTPILTWVYFCDFNWLVVIMVVCPLFKLILMCLLLSTCNTCCEIHDFNLIMYLIFLNFIWFDFEGCVKYTYSLFPGGIYQIMTVPSFLLLLKVSHLTLHFISLHEQTIICQMT